MLSDIYRLQSCDTVALNCILSDIVSSNQGPETAEEGREYTIQLFNHKRPQFTIEFIFLKFLNPYFVLSIFPQKIAVKICLLYSTVRCTYVEVAVFLTSSEGTLEIYTVYRTSTLCTSSMYRTKGFFNDFISKFKKIIGRHDIH